MTVKSKTQQLHEQYPVGTELRDTRNGYDGTVIGFAPNDVPAVEVAWHKWPYEAIPANRDMRNFEFSPIDFIVLSRPAGSKPFYNEYPRIAMPDFWVKANQPAGDDLPLADHGILDDGMADEPARTGLPYQDGEEPVAQSSNYPEQSSVTIIGSKVPEAFKGKRGVVVSTWGEGLTVSVYLGDYRVEIDLALDEVEA